MEGKTLFEDKHRLSLKCVLFLFYGGLGCIYPFLQSNMAHKGFDYNEIYSISVIIPIAALFGPLVFALLVDKWATSNAFAYGKRIRILTAVSLIASIVLYVVLMFGVSRTPPPEICTPQASFMCNKKGAYILQEKCTEDGVCHNWDYNKNGLLNLKDCSYSCQREVQFESNCYERQDHAVRMAALQNSDEDSEDAGSVGEESESVRADDGSGSNEAVDVAKSNDLDGDGIPNDQDPDDDNDGIPDSQDDDDDNDGIPDAQDMDDDNDGIPDSADVDSKMTANDLDGDGIPNDQDDDDDNDGIPDAQDEDDDNDGVPDAQDEDDDNDGIPDAEDTDAKSKGNDLDGDGIPNDQDDDDDNDGIPDTEDPDDDNDGVPDAQDTDDDNDGIPDSRDKDSISKHNDLDGDDAEDDDDDNDGIPDAEDIDDDNDGIPDDQEDKPRSDDLDGDGIPNDQDDDDDNDGIPDSEDTDDDNDGIADAEDVDDDNDGIPDILDAGSRNANDLDGDGIPNDQDDDDDNDGILDDDDTDDDNDGIPDSIDDDDDNDGISDAAENVVADYAAPQICHDSDEDDEDEDEKCYSYSGEVIEVKASFDEHNERDEVEECMYPLDGFKCQIDKAWIKAQESGCKPVIECAIVEQYDDNTSLLYGTSCDGDEDNDGDDDRGDSTFYFYLSIRSLLDFFLLAALTLFNTIVIITTRDPASGVGDFGHQLVWGAIGWIVFFNDDSEQPYLLFIILNTIAAVVLLSPLKMDLSPPEEWWKFKTNPQKFFSVPAFVKYAKKCWLPFLITFALGSLWSIIDSVDESHMTDVPKVEKVDHFEKEGAMRPVWRTIMLAGDLLAIPVLIFSKRIIEVFGTCKILVAAALSLVARYVLLAIFDWELWDVIEDWLLPATLGLTWVTIVLLFRDILPRKATAIAQALPVIAHFGFGRFFGALIGIENDYDHLENDYEIIAGVLFGITIAGIILYRYKEIVLSHVGQYIPSLKPCENVKVAENGKGETDV
ncbi:uncharacterized protein LOC129765373 isoform X2 [Toxorhynchites rutilus septentrionalis]|uniref:uncharacterized protein LOC129765373 isoform X2 n=1 Tax=Toxorhynchites rutilus septentrionalis TaxID=329112 RepID=UPI002478EDD5|nr:uncharacterized protein LOC129765373 isoform X2 [Toxorhynchites rutilus septentrionalis]